MTNPSKLSGENETNKKKQGLPTQFDLVFTKQGLPQLALIIPYCQDIKDCRDYNSDRLF